MNRSHASLSRRGFLGGSIALGLGASAFSTARGAFAEELARTPSLTEGPFYPPKLPLDTDNDLLIVNDAITQAVGEVTHLTGRILERRPASRSSTRPSKSGSATPRASISPRVPTAAATTRTSRASAGSSPARPANTTSAPSSRCPIRAARRTFT